MVGKPGCDDLTQELWGVGGRTRVGRGALYKYAIETPAGGYRPSGLCSGASTKQRRL